MKNTFSAILYGEKGSGCSVAAATSPLPMLVVDVDQNWSSVPRTERIKKVHGRALSVIDWNTAKEAIPVHTEGCGWDVCRVQISDWTMFAKIPKILRERKHAFESVVVDSLSSAGTLALARAWPKFESESKDDAMSQKKWGVVKAHIERTVSEYMYALGDTAQTVKTLVFTAVPGKISETNHTLVPGLPGSARETVQYTVGMCAYMMSTPVTAAKGEMPSGYKYLAYMGKGLIEGVTTGSSYMDALGMATRDLNITEAYKKIYGEETQ